MRVPAVLFFVTSLSSVGMAQVLLRDDFDGTALDTRVWCTPIGPGSFFGRTQIRPPSRPPVVASGRLRLELSTYNPTGLSFYGSEVESNVVYPRDTGLAFKARVRVLPTGLDSANRSIALPCGLVASLFSFTDNGCGRIAIQRRDEIDFEFLTNDIVAKRPRVLTNVFVDAPFSAPGVFAFAQRPVLDLTAWNEFEVRWLPDRVQWLVNGHVVREDTRNVPAGPQTVRLNFWGPDRNFPSAYCAALQPTARPSEERRWFYEVDWVEVCALHDWRFNGVAKVGLTPVSFTVRGPARQSGWPALVLLSLGDGSRTGGLGVVPRSDCRLMLDVDGLLGSWLAVVPVLGLARIGQAATTPRFVLPGAFPRNTRVHYAGTAIGPPGVFASVSATKSFVTQ